MSKSVVSLYNNECSSDHGQDTQGAVIGTYFKSKGMPGAS